jgi:hypothetical protein
MPDSIDRAEIRRRRDEKNRGKARRKTMPVRVAEDREAVLRARAELNLRPGHVPRTVAEPPPTATELKLMRLRRLPKGYGPLEVVNGIGAYLIVRVAARFAVLDTLAPAPRGLTVERYGTPDEALDVVRARILSDAGRDYSNSDEP